MQDLRGKVVLVTGSSTGIGAAVAAGLAGQGCRVAVHYASQADAAAGVVARILEGGGEAALFQADVVDPVQVASMAEDGLARFGRIDILVNNAGSIVQRTRLAEADDELIDRIFHLNARSMLSMCRAVLPSMQARRCGAIINVTSQAARTGGSLGTGLYASTKAYVSTFTRALAKEVVADGIRVNGLSPGVIQTPIHDRFTAPELMEQLRGSIPMGRIGRAEECVGAVLFLASEDMSSYVTGQIIEVNGGLVMP